MQLFWAVAAQVSGMFSALGVTERSVVRSAAVLFIPHHPALHSALKNNLGMKWLKKKKC